MSTPVTPIFSNSLIIPVNRSCRTLVGFRTPKIGIRVFRKGNDVNLPFSYKQVETPSTKGSHKITLRLPKNKKYKKTLPQNKTTNPISRHRTIIE